MKRNYLHSLTRPSHVPLVTAETSTLRNSEPPSSWPMPSFASTRLKARRYLSTQAEVTAAPSSCNQQPFRRHHAIQTRPDQRLDVYRRTTRVDQRQHLRWFSPSSTTTASCACCRQASR